MRKGRIAAAALAVLLGAGVGEAAAQAGGWRGWLDRLSGPGEFRGIELSAEFFCYGVPKFPSNPPVAGEAAAPTLLAREWGGADLACRSKRGSAKVDGQRVDLWKVAVGVEYGRAEAAHNPLEYESASQGEGPAVTLSTLVSTVGFVPNAWLEVGAGAGVGWFSTAGFHTTGKFLVQPLRVAVRPISLLMAGGDRPPAAAGVLQLRFNLTSFPGGFDAADFGATEGSWQVGTEVLKSFSVVLDFGELLRR